MALKAKARVRRKRKPAPAFSPMGGGRSRRRNPKRDNTEILAIGIMAALPILAWELGKLAGKGVQGVGRGVRRVSVLLLRRRGREDGLPPRNRKGQFKASRVRVTRLAPVQESSPSIMKELTKQPPWIKAGNISSMKA